MSKKFDNLFSALMFAAAIAVVLGGGWCLSHSISRAKAEPEAVAVARVHIDLPEEMEPATTPVPMSEITTPAFFDPAIPLSPKLQAALYDACAESGVPLPLALGLIEVESNFEPYADNDGCYGLCQLNRNYFPDKLSPADNLRAGIGWLGKLLEQHGNLTAALCAYNSGSDTGARGYANAVLSAAERWEEQCI